MVTGASISDNELLEQLRASREDSFGEIYRRYQRAIYNYLYKFLKSPELSQDLSQEIFIKLWDVRANLPELQSLKAYLFSLARNHALNYLKRAGVDQNVKAIILRNYPQTGQNLESALHFEDYKRYLDHLLGQLSPQSREVFRLCRQEGKTYDETAELLNISRNTVKKHMVRSMRFLGDSVKRDLGISLWLLFTLIYRI